MVCKCLECSPRVKTQGEGSLELSEFKPEMSDDTPGWINLPRIEKIKFSTTKYNNSSK